MILTDKCLEDFNKWISENHSETIITRDGGDWGHGWTTELSVDDIIDELPNNLQNALIIEFFDSVGITILLDTCGGYFYFVIKETLSNTHVSNCKKYFQEEDDSKTRNEATNHAIAKANKIYNSKEK
jgi:hypothetical protein